MANCNDGQGVGFCVYGFVIDMKMLHKLMMSVKGAVVAVVPFALAYSTLGTATPAGPGTCMALTPVQLGALVAKLSAAGGDGNCTMANLTIAEVLSL